MKFRLLLILCVGAISFSLGCGKELSHNTKTLEKPAAEVVSLFNGKDLTGWETTGNAKWAVQGGMLIGTQGENNAPGDIFTVDSYADFELTVTYRVEWPCNSGVWFRFQTPNKTYQADILEFKNPECYSGSLYCPGKMFLAMNTDKDLVNRNGWNTMKIRAQGPNIKIWLNGTQVADVNDDLTGSGKIGFQIHPGDQFAKMKIVVKEIFITPCGAMGH